MVSSLLPGWDANKAVSHGPDDCFKSLQTCAMTKSSSHHLSGGSMAKIKVEGTVVELDGDEMTRCRTST